MPFRGFHISATKIDFPIRFEPGSTGSGSLAMPQIKVPEMLNRFENEIAKKAIFSLYFKIYHINLKNPMFYKIICKYNSVYLNVILGVSRVVDHEKSGGLRFGALLACHFADLAYFY